MQKFVDWLLSIISLLGFSPEVFLMGKNNFVLGATHAQNGLFLNLILLMAILFNLFISVVIWLLARNNIILSDSLIQILDTATNIPFLLWICLFLIGLLSAIIRRPLSLPFVKRIFAKKFSSHLLLVSGFLSQLVFVLIVGIIFRANSLANQSAGPGSVYMLYDNFIYQNQDINQYPQWIFNLGMYPIAEKAAARWGDGSVVIKPLSIENLYEALSNGRFIFLATHGGTQPGYISVPASPYYDISPDIVNALQGAGEKLQLVYLAGCYTGSLADEWEQALAPANVITFDRISWQIEHIYWLWFVGPEIISQLE
jgi:hypothetical protein